MSLSDTGLVHISDLHFTNSHRTLDSGYLIDSQNSRLKSAVLSEYFTRNRASLGPCAVVITGDLTDSGDEEDYQIAHDFILKLQESGFAVYSTPGNHDYCREGTLWFEDAPDAAERRERYRKYVADLRYPCRIECEFGILVLLDSMQGELNDWKHSDNKAQGRLGPEQLASLKGIIEGYQSTRSSQGKRIVVCLHHSPLHNPQNDNGGCLDDAADFLSIVRGKIDVLLFGHTTPDGILQQGFPSDEAELQIPLLNCENLEHGAWSPETSVGGLAHWVTVGQGDDGRTVVFYIGPDSRVYCNTRQPANGGWIGEKAIGECAFQLCVAKNSDGQLEVFYLGNDGYLYRVRELPASGGWEKPSRLDAQWTAGPSGSIPDAAQLICADRNADGCLEVFYAGPGLNLYHSRQKPDGTFGPGVQLGGTTAHVCVGRNADGRLELFWVGLDRILNHQWQVVGSGDWSAPQRLGGLAETASVARNAQGQLEIIYVGTNSCLYRNRQDGRGGWEGESALGGTARQACLVSNQDGRLEVFYIGTNSFIYHNWQVNQSDGWAGEETLRGLAATARQMGAGMASDGRIDLFYVGMNFHLYHIGQMLPNDAYPVTLIDASTLSRKVQLVPSQV